MTAQNGSAENGQEMSLRRFLHDLAAPLSAVSLHLETAVRRVQKGNDPTESLATAQRELEKAFQLFETGRSKLMTNSEAPKAQS
ncbi:MAG TPA: hypothetical protein VJA66_18640 [Thermoanaerobaculia bacterium]